MVSKHIWKINLWLVISLFILTSLVSASLINWTDYDDKMYSFGVGDNFIKQSTKCNVDSDCYITTNTKCSCSRGGKQIAVNDKGLEYWNWWHDTYATGNFFCIDLFNCKAKGVRCIDKVCEIKWF